MAYDPLSKSGGAKTSSKAPAPAPAAAPPRPSGSVFDPLSGKGGTTKKKSGGGLFGFLGDVRETVQGAGPNLVRFGGSILKELAPTNPFTARHDPTSMGWQGVEKKMPLTAAITESTARTARQIPDTLVSVRPGGPGFGQSNLGRQIRDEGYLSTGLAKVGDLSLLFGGAGLVGKAATGGRLASAGRLERLAGATSEAAGLGKKANFGKLTDAAAKADLAGDAAKSADLAQAAKQVLDAAELRTGVAGASKATRAVEKGTETAFKVARGGDRASALPFLPTQKALGLAGKAVGAGLKSERLAPVMARAQSAIERLGRRQEVGDLYHETVRAPFEAEMMNWFERNGLKDLAQTLDRDEQASVYLARMTREGLDPTVRELLDAVDELPDEVRPDAIGRLFPDGDVTPAQLALARAFDEGTLPEPQQAKLQAAADSIAGAQAQRQAARYETGRGTSRDLSEPALEARRQRAAGEQAEMDVEAQVQRKTAATQGRLATIRAELDELNTAPTPEPVPLSRAQERRSAVLGERTRRASLVAKEEAKRQGAVSDKSRRKLDAAQSQERATRDRFERENQARADRAQQRRFDTLQKRESDALTKLADETAAARDSVEAAPPQDRPALRVNLRAKELALELAEAHPEHARRFASLADDIATTKAQLDAKGIKTEYIFGGAELGDTPSVPRTAKLRRPKKLQSERQRVRGTLARSVKAQGEKFAAETRDILHNEFRGKLQGRMGSTVKDELRVERFATGEKIASQLDADNLVAWDPKTGKLLDAGEIDKNSAVLDKHLYEAVTKWTATKEPGLALKVYDKVTGGWKHSVLALSPRWHIGNIVGNAALATLGAGLSPAQVAKNLGEARRLVKAFEKGDDVPAEHLAALQRILAAGYHNPDLAVIENARAVGRVINKSYEFNSYVDSVNRTMVYLAKKKGGVSSEAAVSMALKAAGDFSKMTPFERNVVRRVIPFYAWQRHISRLAFSLPIEHPARVAWTLHLADMQEQLYPDPGADNEFNEGTIPIGGGKRLNVRQFFPFTSSFWADPTYRGGGYQVNPVLKTGLAAVSGFNLGKMKMVSGKFRTARDEGPSGFGAAVKYLPPKALAEFTAQQLPQVQLARDLKAGEVPVRYDTGEPRKVGPGASKKTAKPTLTGRGRKETLARFLGVPIPETETKATTKKK